KSINCRRLTGKNGCKRLVISGFSANWPEKKLFTTWRRLCCGVKCSDGCGEASRGRVQKHPCIAVPVLGGHLDPSRPVASPSNNIAERKALQARARVPWHYKSNVSVTGLCLSPHRSTDR